MEATPHLLHVFPSFVPAGSQVRTAKLIAAFGQEFRHSILALDGRLDAREILPAKARVDLLDSFPKAGTAVTAWKLRASLRSLRPDLLLTYNFGSIDALIAARLCGGWPAVHHEDGFGPDEAAGFKRRRIWLRRWFLPQAHRLVVISDTLRKIALERWRETPLHLRFIPNGIEVERFETRDGQPALRRELGLPDQAIVVGAVGHLRPEKNLSRLLRAVALATSSAPLCLIVLGDGPMRAALEGEAAAAGLENRVRFVGHRTDPRPFYRAFDVFALTSDTEQMPLSLLEAMASGLPAVATNVGDVVAMLPGEQAPFVALPGGEACTQALATSISRLAADPGLRARLGEKNQGRVRQFYSQRAMVDAYREVYRQAIASRHA